MRPSRVLSGGQSGVDRAALDAALAIGLPAGGWCPAGRWAEDGPIAARYPLLETASADPDERTRRNVEEADALLVLAPSPATGGTALALQHARALGRPALVVDPFAADAIAQVTGWAAGGVVSRQAGIVNVAGSRESGAPGIYAAALRVLTEAWRR